MLSELVPDQIWHARQPVRLGPLHVDTRMTIVRLADRSLWVHSPIHPTTGLIAAILTLGPVSHIIAPNRSHHLHFRDFLAAFPEAAGHIAPGLAEKCPGLAGYPVMTPHDMPWSGILDGIFIDGLPVLNEIAWHHRASGTLILTDFLFCIGCSPARPANLVARLLGVHERLAMSRSMRFLVRDRAALARSVAALRRLDVRRIVLAHDTIIETDAALQLDQALAWLGDRAAL